MNAQHKKLILASSSPRRQELIRTFGLPVEIIVSHADEEVEDQLNPQQIVETLALRKTVAVYEEYKRRMAETEVTGKEADVSDHVSDHASAGVIIGADTIVVLDGRVMGKPKDDEDAFGMLNALQGRTHQVYTGVCCMDTMTGASSVGHRVTDVSMKPLRKEQLLRYIATGEPHDKAGSYAIQGFGATLVDSIRGDYFNVVGLPLALLSEMLAERGVEII